ncbi:MAG: tRNA (adenosine(37)-N6)-threonylcarbamoyltransferase complex dimerization subunit type 1 TsaB, partial [Candidatus Ratteibacteria bacterium]
MYLFSIECSTWRAGIAVLENQKVLAKKIWVSEDTSAEIFPEIDKMLKKTGLEVAQFEYFIVSTGPGSWTGVRLGLAVAYGLAIADKTKVFGLSSLEAMAYQMKNENNVSVFLPSVRNSVHFGFFRKPSSMGKKHGKFSSCTIEQLSEKLKN